MSQWQSHKVSLPLQISLKKVFFSYMWKTFFNTNKTSSNKKNIGTKNTQTHAKATRVIVFFRVPYVFFSSEWVWCNFVTKGCRNDEKQQNCCGFIAPFLLFYLSTWSVYPFFCACVYLCVLTLLLFICLHDDEKV